MATYELAACPACGTNDFLTVASADDIRSQYERLWEFHLRRIRDGAPLQPLFDRAVFSQRPPLHVVACTACGTVLRNPRETPQSLVDLYATEEPPTTALQELFQEAIAFFRPRVQRLEKLTARGSVLEVGSYNGAFLRAASERGWQAAGIDVNERANAFARAHHSDVRDATLEDVPGAAQYDVVAIWNCFDQLPDPRSALTHARRLVKSNGLVTLRVPNGACYTKLVRMPAAQALLAHNNLLGFPYRHGFTPAALRRLLDDHGFSMEELHADALVSTASAWTKGWARAEARAVKRLMRALLPSRLAPWLEVYARAV